VIDGSLLFLVLIAAIAGFVASLLFDQRRWALVLAAGSATVLAGLMAALVSNTKDPTGVSIILSPVIIAMLTPLTLPAALLGAWLGQRVGR
jgi:hypothetical protein